MRAGDLYLRFGSINPFGKGNTTAMTDTSGTPIPVPDNFPCSWPDPQDATLTWHRETMHCPEALPALASDFWQTVWQGLDQSFRHYGEPHQPLLRWINNYIYVSWSLTVKPDEKEAAEKRARQAQEADAANLQPLWEDEFLPEIQDYLDCWDRFDLAGAPPDQFQRHVGKTWDWLSRIWILHFRLPNWQGRTLFIDYCKELFGEEEPNPAQRLTQGLPTKTTDMGRALWALSQRIPPAMSAVIASGATAEIRGALDDFLAAYGHRGNHWGLQYPTWIEDPSPVFAAQATEREEVLAAVRTRLGLPADGARPLRGITRAGPSGRNAQGEPQLLDRLQLHQPDSLWTMWRIQRNRRYD